MTVSALEGKEKSGEIQKEIDGLPRPPVMKTQLTEGETPNKIMPSPLDSSSLPKYWIVTCV